MKFMDHGFPVSDLGNDLRIANRINAREQCCRVPAIICDNDQSYFRLAGLTACRLRMIFL